MTEPSTTPTLEQRAAAISVHCPVGWSVRAHGPGFAIYSSGLSDRPPHSLMHGDDMAVLTAIWSWHTSDLDQTLRALKDLASRLGCAVADSLPGFFERQTTGFSKRVLALVHRALGRDQLAEDPAATPIRAYDAVAELAQEHAAVRKKWSGSASERDEFWKVLRALGLGDAETLADFTARWLGCAHALAVAEKHIATTEREGVRNGEEQLRLHAAVEAAEKLVTKRETDIFDLRSEVEALKKAAEVAPIDRDMLSDALDCARREVVWVPESSRAVLDEQLDNSLLAYGFASSDIAKMSAAQKADEISKAQQRAAGVTAVPATTTRQTDEAGESEQVRNAIEWCTTHAGRGLAAELAQDAARKLQASLATMTGRPTLRWAIAQALHIGAEAAIEWAERYWGGKLEAQQVELRQLREDQTDYQALLELQRARRDLSIYEADSCGVAELAATAIAKFSKLPMAIEARSYDIKRRAKIAVRIEPDTAKPRVVGNPVPRPSPAARIAEQIKADLNKPAAKPGRNVMDEVLGLGEATERFDRAYLGETAKRYETVLSADAVPADLEARQNDRLHIPGDNPGRVRSMNGLDEHFALPGIGFVAARWAGTLARGEHWRIVADVLPDYAIRGIADSWGWSRKIAGETFTSAGYKTPAEAFKAARKHREELKAAMDRGPVRTPAAVIAAMFPLARRLLIIDQHAVVDGNDPRAHIVKADVQISQEQEQAAVVCSVMPTGEINVLKNRQDGKVGLITPVEGATFASMTWTGSAWVPVAGPFTVTTTMDSTEYAATFQTGPIAAARIAMGVDGPARAPVWTGITWMSGKGRAKSLTLPGLRLIDENGKAMKLRTDVAGFTDKAKRIFNKLFENQRLIAVHLQNGVVRHATFDCYSEQAEAGDIVVRLSETKAVAPKPTRQGIAWRSAEGDEFAEVPIRPTFDEIGNNVIEVHAELPEGLQHEIKQTSRDRPTITATTVNGAKITGPVIGWEQELNSGGVGWRLTVPMRNPTPRT